MKTSKKIVAMLALGIAISFGANNSIAIAAETNSVVEVQSVSEVDWINTQMVIATGNGISSQKSIALARRAALVDAQRNLAIAIQNFIGYQDDSLSATIKDFQVISERQVSDESYSVTLGIPIYGASSVSANLVSTLDLPNKPKKIPNFNKRKSKLKKAEIKSMKNEKYTGLIIDARGLNFTPNLLPQIFKSKNDVIYEIQNVAADQFVENGLVKYSNDIESAKIDPRIGSNPLIISDSLKSVKNFGIMVSAKDADRILLANKSGEFLENGAVIIVF